MEDDGGSSVRSVLVGAGAVLKVKKKLEDKDFPRAKISVNAFVPFFVGVYYRCEREPEIGKGGTVWFVTFFGICSKIGETGRFVT